MYRIMRTVAKSKCFAGYKVCYPQTCISKDDIICTASCGLWPKVNALPDTRSVILKHV